MAPQKKGATGEGFDPIAMEVFNNRLLSITEDMGNILIRSSFSTNIKERRDCSVGLFDARGRLIAQGSHVPLHLGSLLGSVEAVLERYTIDAMLEGDAYILNDPYMAGGTHMPDISIVTPSNYIGALMELVRLARGSVGRVEAIDPQRVLIEAKAPLGEILVDFFDRLKSSTRGYASLDYHVADYRPVQVQVVDILVNGSRVDALSSILHRDRARNGGLEILSRLRKVIPRQLFQVALQAVVGGRVIARETIPALRKDVLAKCYGGDVSRKRKLLKKQAEGKKRMKMVGQVEIPQEAFTSVLQR